MKPHVGPGGLRALSSLSSVWAVSSLAVLGGCASQMVMIDGVAVPRVTLEVTGQAISVRHRAAHPRPGGPSGGVRGDGGSIGGLVCGMQVDYDVSHEADHLQLIGFIDGGVSAQLRMEEKGGDRLITGAIGRLGVDLKLSPARIEGHVGTRVFYAEQQGDRFLGHIRVPGLYKKDSLGDGAFPVAIDGREYLLGLPAADQAALLPTVLTCWWAVSENVADAMHVGFGGESTALPANTSSLYVPDAAIVNRPR